MKKDNTADTTNATQKPTCGIIMPISACTSNGIEYSAEHWQSVRTFLEDAIKEAGCEPKAVWEGEDQSIIHGRIVNNIAEFPLMICVVCGCNNNVMIELGLRLMTDKPVLVIADDNYKIPFDVNVLEMIVMPTVTWNLLFQVWINPCISIVQCCQIHQLFLKQFFKQKKVCMANTMIMHTA